MPSAASNLVNGAAFDDKLTDLSNLGSADASAVNTEGVGWINQKYPLGTERREGGNVYRYCQFDTSDVAITAGMIVYQKVVSGVVSPYVVTADVSDSNVNLVAGVMSVAVTTGRTNACGWVQRGGYVTNVVSDGSNDGAAGDVIIGAGDGTGDVVAGGTAPTRLPVGVLLASESASLFPKVWLVIES